jgi:uncharacterized membrane protein/nitrite reductase/ring-hydroxylating ferredoxin subunit
MKSRASFRGHPIHPMLVTFPIAFFAGTLFFDVLGLVYEKQSFWQTGYYLEISGVITALAAAVPGIIDFFYTVPPKSTGKKRAAKHGLLNLTQVIIFFSAWLLRKDESIPGHYIIGLEAMGMIILSVAGWMGGTLVFRNQIGVDPRYANAGKWNEEYFPDSDAPVKVATSSEVKLNQMKLVHLNGKRIVIARTENGFAAFDDRCTHRGGSLAGGSMICGTVQCPWHGSQFDVLTGEVKAGPAKDKIATYILTEKEGQLFLQP